MTDAQILAAIAPAADDRWRQLFGMPLWGNPVDAADEVVDVLAQLLYDLEVDVTFDWLTWYSPGRYPDGEGLASAPVADSVRMLASYLHGERVATGAIRSGLVDGSIPASINRLWDWYRECRVGEDTAFVDHAEYSADGTYLWSYERRWAPGGALCWVGLNPGPGDRDAGSRPALRRVASWARREGCAAVVVVNLYSLRSMDPTTLHTTTNDIVGDRTDDTIRATSRDARITLAAWGASKMVRQRSTEVLELLDNPLCVGVNKNGEPRHPLYVPAATALVPYGPPESTSPINAQAIA
jgi:hypothetical protein